VRCAGGENRPGSRDAARRGPTPRRSILALVLTASATLAGPTLSAQHISVSGTFHVIWGDPSDGRQSPLREHVLIDDQGVWRRLRVRPAVLDRAGGDLALNGRRVTIAVEPRRLEPGDAGRTRVAAIADAGAAPGQPEHRITGPSGPQPWLTIPCRFADLADVTPQPRAHFESLYGSDAPGLDHFWRQASGGVIDLSGSLVLDWVNLPYPRDQYVYDVNGDGRPEFDLQRATTDCAAAADGFAYFPDFRGISFMFNAEIGCCAYGGGTTLALDGETRTYRATWLPPWAYATQRVVAHEMGHGFGLPHSSGPYGMVYDSQWDLMSGGGTCEPAHPSLGCVGVHTIAHHRSMLGWLPRKREYVAGTGTETMITLQRTAQPPGGAGAHLAARVPVSGDVYYTVEARKFTGYDVRLPGEAIVIHRVQGLIATVVDVDGDGDANDDGAMWLPGETFTGEAGGIEISVVAESADGFLVSIRHQDAHADSPASLEPPARATHLDGRAVAGSPTVYRQAAIRHRAPAR
jgi:hypothetical protein